MSERNTISQEQLQAFVDGQLDSQDKAGVLLALEASDELRMEVADLRRLKDMVCVAYDEVPEPGLQPIDSPRTGRLALAASVGALAMLLATQLVQWALRDGSPDNPPTVTTVTLDSARASLAAGDPELVMFHISTSDDRVGAELLDQVELVAGQYRRWGRSLRIVVIANNEGLRLYQVGHSRNERRIYELFTRFDNITFAACGTTLNRLTRSGDPVQLLPQTILVDSGVVEIAKRQKEGWKYIRI